jgi:transketolase
MEVLNEEKTSAVDQKKIDQLCINTLRFLSVDAVQKANSGHPGLPLGAAPMAYILWTKYLKHNPKNPLWFNRDRFVLSAGHGSMLLYSLLHLTGYNLPLEQIKNFRQWESMTPGHPERGITPGVEVTTGPLGQGFANGVGMAIAQAYLAARYNQPEFEIIDNYIYGLVSDGDLMEGIASEAASIAGHLKLGKLIYLYDNNHITLSASTDVSFTEDKAKRFGAYGWQTISVENGNNLESIDKAIKEAKLEKNRPSLILIRTHIGYGSPNKQDTFEAHGSPLGEDEVKLTKENLNWPVESDFLIPEEALEHFRQAIKKGSEEEQKWNNLFQDYDQKYPELAKELDRIIKGNIPDNWDSNIPSFPTDKKGMATRKASGKVMEAFCKSLPELIGGSADLNPSTFTQLKNMGDFQPPTPVEDKQGSAGGAWNFSGRNLQFGVRENAMGGISNGLAAYGGIRPYCATFLIFSDYMRPTIRLAAIMKLNVVYVFTHDSIGLGEDGTTHQPIEHLASLRAMPNITVIRPADANETAVAWKAAIKSKNRPVALILTRQDVPTLDRNRFGKADGLLQGAYILEDVQDPELILIATGSEVNLIVEAADLLKKENIRVRLVSMPSWELFEEQDENYRNKILPANITCRLAVEAASSMGWEKYVGPNGEIIGIDEFGSSAPAKVLFKEFGFTADHVFERAKALLKKTKNG